MKRYRINVIGRVQGVFFRASTLTEANRIGVSGWVKNESDGSVVTEAQGTTEQLDQFIKWCHRGPELSVVREVLLDELPVLEDDKSFQIRY